MKLTDLLTKKNLIRKSSINEAKEVKLPKDIYLANMGRNGEYALEFQCNRMRTYTLENLSGIGQTMKETYRKNNGKFQGSDEGKAQVIVREGNLFVQFPFKSKLEPDEIGDVVGGKMAHTF